MAAPMTLASVCSARTSPSQMQSAGQAHVRSVYLPGASTMQASFNFLECPGVPGGRCVCFCGAGTADSNGTSALPWLPRDSTSEIATLGIAPASLLWSRADDRGPGASLCCDSPKAEQARPGQAGTGWCLQRRSVAIRVLPGTNAAALQTLVLVTCARNNALAASGMIGRPFGARYGAATAWRPPCRAAGHVLESWRCSVLLVTWSDGGRLTLARSWLRVGLGQLPSSLPAAALLAVVAGLSSGVRGVLGVLDVLVARCQPVQSAPEGHPAKAGFVGPLAAMLSQSCVGALGALERSMLCRADQGAGWQAGRSPPQRAPLHLAAITSRGRGKTTNLESQAQSQSPHRVSTPLLPHSAAPRQPVSSQPGGTIVAAILTIPRFPAKPKSALPLCTLLPGSSASSNPTQASILS
ncbi:hypothetical protein Micbo1qcDRAFT_175802 [Microdochium bolleyi]|uniref:Uncharacterized protein n=1 Tax=Microdochium bolleyi TaxID=196109 RepID=A0A136J0N8_9PEZI|nr:hypothetical protein Micbo1qcDRAFT_175802 [Microdochium bolleyi]